MEVGEGSSIAREMGRSWTTHTGGGGAAGTGKQRKKKKKNGKKNAKPAWASVEVPDWDGVPDVPASGKSDMREAGADQVLQNQSKKTSKKVKSARPASMAIDVTETPSAVTAGSDGNTQKKRKQKQKEAKRKQCSPERRSATAPVPQRKQSANSGIFSIDDASPAALPPSRKKCRKSAVTDERSDDAVRATEAAAAGRAEKQQQREQQRREAAEIAATTELRPEEEQQLEKGASLLLRKLKGAAEAKRLASAEESSSASRVGGCKGAKNKSLHSQYKKKLSGARFRYLNEMLYTSKGADSFLQFQEDPELFDVYHSGFREQVEAWPVNPVDIILKRLARLEQRHSRHGTASTSGRFAVADFGCGDAAIAQSTLLCSTIVHSFDLVARNDWVTSADMARVPLPEGAVNVAVFSLSLMGVNYIDYIVEAHRVVAPGGRLLIAEVHSRIENFDKFEKTISNVGFLKKAEDKSNRMFVLYEFERLTGRPLSDLDRQTLSVAELKPCIYKRR